MQLLVTILMLFTFLTFSSLPVEIDGEIHGDEDISAVSCMKERMCVLASDELNELQVFTYNENLKKMTINKNSISLGSFSAENDIEGMANDGTYFYAVGSHGVAKKSGAYQPSRYHIFRLLLNERGELLELKMSSLSSMLKKENKLSGYFQKSLQKNGLNIEGLAFHKGQLFLGFRAPLINGKAPLLRLSFDELFENFEVNSLNLFSLGVNTGFRSLEFHEGDLYFLSGRSVKNKRTKKIKVKASIGKINYSSFEIEWQKELENPKLKAEALSFVNGHEALVMYDSQLDGKPEIIEPESL